MFFSLRQTLRLALLYLLAFSAFGAPVMAAPAVALHYSHHAPLEDLKLFDIVVVEPDHGHDPVSFKSKGSELYAYASVAEVQPTRS